MSDNMVERLAAIEHERWSGWMRWMFDNWTIDNIARWGQQMHMAYDDLPEHSKESDRKEVRKTLIAMRQPTEAMLLEGGGNCELVWKTMITEALKDPD